MSGNILHALPELVDSGILTQDKAKEIKEYFNQKTDKSQGRLIIVFAVLGAVLIGLGIILIIAHNWDELPKTMKTALAFFPLIAGQLICVFVILRKRASIAWREGASVFLFFAVGASISLISQIYNIHGNLSSFLLTWMILCLPLVYLMKSSVTALLVIIGITFYSCEASYWTGSHKYSFEYWLIMTALIPHYYMLFKTNPKGNFMMLLNWMIPLSLIICLGTLADQNEEWMFIAYFSLFGMFYIIGDSESFMNKPIRNNSFLVLGSIGTIVILLMLSFDWFWDDLLKADFNPFFSGEFYIAVFLTLVSAFFLSLHIKKQSINSANLMHFIFLIFVFIFISGFFSVPVPVILINMFTLIIGVLIIKKGADKDHLGIMNYGLAIVTALVICRFFDTNISFVVRGLLFVILGAGFFVANYRMIKKRKANEN